MARDLSWISGSNCLRGTETGPSLFFFANNDDDDDDDDNRAPIRAARQSRRSHINADDARETRSPLTHWPRFVKAAMPTAVAVAVAAKGPVAQQTPLRTAARNPRRALPLIIRSDRARRAYDSRAAITLYPGARLTQRVCARSRSPWRCRALLQAAKRDIAVAGGSRPPCDSYVTPKSHAGISHGLKRFQLLSFRPLSENQIPEDRTILHDMVSLSSYFCVVVLLNRRVSRVVKLKSVKREVVSE